METAEVRLRIKGSNVYYDPKASAFTVGSGAGTAYDGASQAPRLVRWQGSGGGPNSVLGGALSTLRQRSRDRARKDGLADSGLEAWVANTIGTGIKPQFATPDAGLNKALAELWLAWTDESDADGRSDFYGQQAIAARSMLDGGDCFARLRTRLPADGLTVPLQVQLLESEFCPVEKTEALPGGAFVHQGVQFDRIARRTHYWLHRTHPRDHMISAALGNSEAHPVPAQEVAHVAAVRRPGMVRGEPALTRALVRLYDLDQYDDAQLVRQKIAAMHAGFAAPAADGFYPGQEDGEDGLSLAPMEPGSLQVVPPGTTVTWNQPPSPGESFEAYMRHQERRAAVSVGVLYEMMSGDFSQLNDRQFRAALNEFKRRCRMWQHNIVVFQLCRPVMLRWAELAVLSGAIRLPEGITTGQVARCKWVPQGWEYLNPVQDVQAKREEVRAGFRSRAAVVSEAGDDVEQTDAEIATDNARADRDGLIFDTDPRRTASTGASQAKPAGSGFVDPGEDPDKPEKEREAA